MHTDTALEFAMLPVHQQTHRHRHLRTTSTQRQLDEVDYWRAQAGWVDDAADMSAYQTETTGGGALSGNSAFGNTPDEIAKNVLKLLSIVVALGLSILFFRAIMRRMNADKERKRSEKSRSGSSRRSRSRSRSRKGDYDLMKDDDGGDEKSKRSTRSRSSRSRRSRSRSRTERSRSKSRSRHADKSAEHEAVLV